jgi:hypothetical protein
MVVLPVATPETTPPEVTVAIAVLLLLHVPPATEFAKDAVWPRHTAAVPVIGSNGFTVSDAIV